MNRHAVAFVLGVAGFAVGYLAGALGGWQAAHKTVADECNRLGGFYVGDKTFLCTGVHGRDEVEKQ